MKISMIPDNSLKTIHASQNDVGRKWEFDLYDNEGMVDVSNVMPQIIYPVSTGGTEQILPENGATPVTSPILADIDYPDELRNDQMFTYRQVPSVLDGNAKITKIKGNSIVWNQLVQNGNFADTSNWNSSRLTVSGNVGTLTFRTDQAYNHQIYQNISNIVKNHLYYFCAVNI